MQDQWSWVFSNFGISDIWEMGKNSEKDGNIYQKTFSIDTAAELPKEIPLIILAPPAGQFIQGTVSLADFTHPENAIYIFGGSRAVLTEEDLGGRKPQTVVYIPTVKHEMYSHTAAYVTLWDRYVKRGDFG